MLTFKNEEIKSHKDAKLCYIRGKRFLKKFPNYKNYWKFRDHCHYTGKYRGAAHTICNLKLNVPNEIPVAFHNGSNYDYHFIIKELAKELEGKFECLGENTEKYKTFSVPIEKEIDKDGNESVVTISCKINLLIVQDLWQVHYQILLIISQNEFTKLNVKIVIVFLNMKVSRTI